MLPALFAIGAEEKTDLAQTHSHAAAGDVGVGADVMGQFGHETLAEAHHLVVRLALGFKVAAPPGAADGQHGQRVLEDLLERQGFEGRKTHRGVKTQPALERAEDTVHLHPIAAIDVDLAGIIHPGHPEDDAALGLDKPLQNRLLAEIGAAVQHRLHPVNHFGDRLVKFIFLWISIF